jgi:hypothetical protein
MSRWCGILVAAVMIVSAPAASAQTTEERAAARDLVAKHGNAVVFVLGTAKVRINQGGREQNQDSRIQALVTILDSSGLGVMSLTTLDPGELLTAQMARGRGAAAGVSVQTEASDLRYRMPDGKEVPVRVVLRDKELDLAFLRPMEKLAAPVAAIDLPTARPAIVDAVVEVKRLPESAGWQSTALFHTVQAVVEKPRTFFILTGGVVGSPVFDTRSQFVGVIVRLRNEADAASAQPIVLPAADIREVAKQAN